jgi:hypothetical protein
MPVGYYTGTYGSTITLRAIYNPATVGATGFVNVNNPTASVAGVLGTAGSTWTLVNKGTIQSVGNLGNGVVLQSGGTVTNTGGLIQGTGQGVQILGAAGTINNSGMISQTGGGGSNGISLSAGGKVTNTGTINAQGTISGHGIIFVGTGGTVINGASNSTAAYIGGGFGIVANTGAASPTTVVNYGSIIGLPGANHSAISLSSGGIVQNGAVGATTALIDATGGTNAAISMSGTAGTVTNFGTVKAVGTNGLATGIFFAPAGGAVTNSGTVFAGAFGANATGISLNNGGTATNSGLINAAYGQNESGIGGFSAAGATVVNTGTITASGTTSGQGVNISTGSVSNTGLISGSSNGVTIFSGVGTVLNTGTITSTATGLGNVNGSGISLNGGGTITNNGMVSTPFADNGVAINTGARGGEILNSANGLITAYHDAVGIFPGTVANPGTLTLINSGTVQSTQTGTAAGNGFSGFAVQTGNGGRATISNFGTIQSFQTNGGGAILLNGGGFITNGQSGSSNGLIQSPGYGIQFNNTTGVVVNFGTVASTTTGTFGRAISLNAGGIVVNYGLVSGTRNPIVVNGVTGHAGAINISNASGTVLNIGTVTSTNAAGNGVNLLAGGTIFNNTGATITGLHNGIYIGGTLNVPTLGALGFVMNYGTISSTGTSSGVVMVSGGVVTNRNLISSSGNGVSLDDSAGTITNFGTVAHAGPGTSGVAVYLGGGGTVTNYGMISGAAPGTSATGYPGAIDTKNQPVTIRNFGTVTNPNNSNGVNLLDGGTLINGSASVTAATISGMRGGIYIGGTLGTPTPGAFGSVINYGTIQNFSSAAQAVRLVSGGAVTNFGLIDSARTGISFANTAGVIDNFGNIVSTASTSFTSGAGVYLQNGGQITNEAGGSITAQRAAVSLGGTSTTTASAIVTNSGVLTGNDGVQIGANDTGSNTIVNFGTIIGTSGTAIDLGGDGAQIISEPGSQLNGIIANFKAGDSIDLPGVNAFSLSYVNGVLSLFNQTTPVAQLGVSTPYINPQFSEAADGNGGTLVTVAPPGGAVLFDFVYRYDSGGDYYYGQVADDGTFGYQIGQQIATPAGQYTILSQEPGAVGDPAGTVFVNYYSHTGIGQASTTPLNFAGGQPDGAAGLGSESDFLVGANGLTFPFSSTSEASLPANTLFGFVFTYPDGSSFYSGTVSDNGSFGYAAIAAGSGVKQVFSASGQFEGSYLIYQEGTTALPAGTVTINRYFSGQLGEGFAVDQALSGGSNGLTSETGIIDINGTQVAFGDPPEAALPASNPAFAIPGVAAADPATAVGEIYQQMLGRSPDASGLATYGAMLANGAGIATVQSVIAHSPEVQNDLNLAYQQVLGRAADSGGLAAYEDALAAGNTLANLRAMLAQSPEAQNDLNQLYLQVLGRDGDNGGLDTYASQLAQGGSLGAVRMILAQSGEAQGDINQIYQQVLGRGADNGGLATYEDTLGGGWSLAEVRSNIAYSAEAQSDLTQLFDGALNRDPNAAELAGAENTLAQGGSLAGIAGTLSGGGTAGGFATVTASAGDATLSAAAGPTQFLFSDVAFGQDTIQGFDPTQDAIVLSHAQAADAATVLADASATGAGTLITLNPAQSILLQGAAPASLHQNNFQIV